MEILLYVIYIYIAEACKRHNVDILLFLAVGLKEKGDYAWTDAVIGDLQSGISISPMQLNLAGAGAPPPGWNRQNWANDLTKPAVWTDVAAAHIAYLIRFFNGDIRKAVAGYNRGAWGTVDNSAYVNEVMANYARLQAEGFQVVGSGDHDRQTFLPETGKWTGYATEHAPLAGGISEAYDNVLGVANEHAAFLARLEAEIKAHPR